MTDAFTTWRFLSLTDDFKGVFLHVNHLFVKFEGEFKFNIKNRLL